VVCVCAQKVVGAHRVRAGARAVALGDAGSVSRETFARCCLVTATAVMLTFMMPAFGHAGWPLGSAARVTLGFGESYSAVDGDGSQHRGVDLEASPGAAVLAPIAGRVSFIGSVPGVGGGRVTAVTIESGNRKLTLLPLARADVKRGAELNEGASVGTLASDGDGSAATTHLHVGMRVGELYVDPLGVLEPPPTSGEPGGGQASEAVVQPGAGESVRAVTGEKVANGLPAGVSLVPNEGAGQISGADSVAGQLAPGVSIATRAASASAAKSARVAAPSVPAAATALGAASEMQPVFSASEGAVTVPQAARQAPAGRAAAGIAAFTEGLLRAAVRGVRVASVVLLCVFAAMGALWPLWRGGGWKGSGKVCAGSLEEDVAAASGR